MDRTTTPYLATLPWGRFVDLLEARIIDADPAAAEARREAAELDRFVVTGQSTEHGLKTLIAKATAGEVIYLVAMVDRLAQILELEGDTSPGRRPPLQGIGHPRPPGPCPRPAPQVRDARSVVEERACETSSVVEERACERLETTAPETSRSHPRPSTCTSPASRCETGEGVARMEGVGPITIGQASEFLRHSHVTDQAGDRPRGRRTRRLLRSARPAARAAPPPHPRLRLPVVAVDVSRRMDVDHTTPWSRQARPPGTARPPGQTRIGNLGKLTRFEHRTKTHGPGWRHRQPEPGVHVWRTPHGYRFRVDAHRHPLPRRGLDKWSPSPVEGLDHPTAAQTPLERAFARIVDRPSS